MNSFRVISIFAFVGLLNTACNPLDIGGPGNSSSVPAIHHPGVESGPVSVSVSTVTANAVAVPADGITQVTVTVTLMDEFKSGVKGKALTLAPNRSSGHDTILPASTTTDAQGKASFTIKSIHSGSATFTVTDTTDSLTLNQTVAVNFSPTTVSALNSTLTATGPIVADGVSSANVTITLRDTSNNPVAGIVPTFSATDTGATNVYSACTQSDDAGVSTCTLKSTKAETKTLALTSPVGFTGGSVTFVAGAGAQLGFSTQPGGGISATIWPTQPVVEIQDAFGNPITTGADSTRVVTVALTTGAGTLTGTLTKTAVNGVADFSGNNLKIDTTGSNKVLTASATLTSGPVTCTSASFPISSGSGTQIAFTTEPGGGTAGVAWTTQPIVEIQDGSGNRVSAGADSTRVVTIALTTGSGTLAGTLTKTAIAGVADFSAQALSLNLVGTNKVLTASTTLTGGAVTRPSSAFTITHADASQIVFTTQPSGGVSNVAFTTQPIVQIRDALGNLVTTGTDATRVVTMALSTGSGALAGTVTKTASGGVADFSGQGLKVNLIGTGKVLTASTTITSGAVTVDSSAFTVTSAGASQLVFTTQPSSTTVAGVALSTQPVVEIQDAQGNVVTTGADSSRVVTLTLTTGSGTLAGTLTKTASNGVANFAGQGVNINLVGSDKVLAASATITAGAVTKASNAFAITHAAASQLEFTTQPSASTKALIPFAVQPVVTIEDAFGNPVTTGADATRSITLALQTGTGSLAGNSLSKTATGGVADFVGLGLNVDLVGTNKVLRASGTLTGGAVTVDTNAFTITHALASVIAVTTQPGGGTAGSAWGTQPVAEIRDAFGNVVTTGVDATANVAATLTTGTGTLAGTTTKAASGGIVTFTNLSSNLVGTDKVLTLTKADTSGSSGTISSLTTTSAYTITAGAAAKLAFSQLPSTTAIANVAFTQQPKIQIQDAYGNSILNSDGAATDTIDLTASTLSTCASDSATGLTGASVAASNGLATFSTLKYATAQTIYLKAVSSTHAGLTPACASSSTVVSVGSPDATQSTFTVSSANIKKGETSTLNVIAKDAGGNVLTAGNLTVTFATSGAGTSTGTIGSTTFNSGTNTYSATFTATGKGNAKTLVATITGPGDLSTTRTVTVTNTAPIISPVASSFVFPLSGSNTSPPIVQGVTFSIATTSDTDSDTVTLTCTYKTLGLSASDPNYAASGTNCTALPTLKTTNGTLVTSTLGTLTNSMSWTPTSTQRGTFEFTFDASDGSNAATQTVVDVTVREPITTTNLLSSVDGLFSTTAGSLANSTPAGPNATASTATDWLNLISSGSTSALYTTATPWVGTGTSTSPYAISLNGTSDYIDAGAELSGATKASLSAWVKPSAPTTMGTVIVGNGGGSGNGLVLRQSSTPTGRAEFVVGQKYYSYRDLVLSMAPSSYWRFNDTSTTAYDISAYGNNATFSGTPGTSYLQNQTGALYESDAATYFNGASGYVSASDARLPLGSAARTFSVWINPTILPTSGFSKCFFNYGSASSNAEQDLCLTYPPGGGGAQSIRWGGYGNDFDTVYTLPLNTWTHLAFTFDGTTAKLYVNGVFTNSSNRSTWNTVSSGTIFIGKLNRTSEYFQGSIDELTIFSSALSQSQILGLFQTGKNGNYVTYPGNAILADKPVGYWRLGEKSGARAADLSGNANDGKYAGGIALGQSNVLQNDISAAASFDGGPSTYVDIGSPAVLQGMAALSVEFWAYVPSTWSTTGSYSSIIDKCCTGGHVYTVQAVSIGSSVMAFTPFNSSGTSATVNIGDFNTYKGSWVHVVGTYNGEQVKAYLNGALQNSAALTGLITTNVSKLGIGGRVGSNSSAGTNVHYTGKLSEVAIYNYALSPSQVSAHYNSGNGASWWYCQSQTQLSSSNWNLLQGLWDGTKNTLFVNGQKECEVTPGTPASSYTGTAHIIAGSDTSQSSTSFWQGLLSQFSFFGTNDGTTVASSATAKTDFDASANRYRPTPQENIVTAGLNANFDAAIAARGLGPYANGCSTLDLSWFDLSKSASNGTLKGFASCGATLGWVGSGTVASPYSLAFNGNNASYVNLAPGTTLLPVTTEATLSVWVKTSTNSTDQRFVSINKSGTGSSALALLGGRTAGRFSVFFRNASDTLAQLDSPASALVANTIFHVAATFSGSTATLYVNGVAVSQDATFNPASTFNFDSVTPVKLGIDPSGASGNLNGNIYTAQIYNSLLTPAQVKQNCLAQERRFTSTPGSICAAP